jgi:hypothetical protein
MSVISGQVLVFSSQQQEPVTMGTIAPRWTNIFQKWDTLKRPQKEDIIEDLSVGSRNPVAEAYGWGDIRYYDRDSPKFCSECTWFSWSWSFVITGRDNELCLDQPIVKLKGEQFASHFYRFHNGHQENNG